MISKAYANLFLIVVIGTRLGFHGHIPGRFANVVKKRVPSDGKQHRLVRHLLSVPGHIAGKTLLHQIPGNIPVAAHAHQV